MLSLEIISAQKGIKNHMDKENLVNFFPLPFFSYFFHALKIQKEIFLEVLYLLSFILQKFQSCFEKLVSSFIEL